MIENRDTQCLAYFAALVTPDDPVLLFEAAVSLGQDSEPGLDPTVVQIKVDRLALILKRRLPMDISPAQKLRLLNLFFYQELGFCGNANDYYHSDNSYIHRVVATRRGIPITLAVIYMEIAHQIGLPVRGISFPGHFLMRLTLHSGDIILDPFNGSSLSREELEARLEPYLPALSATSSYLEQPLASFLQPASGREILVRMLRNLKVLFSEQQAWNQLLKVQKRLVVLLPDDVTQSRDRGLAYANLECPQAAVEDIEHYLAARPDASDAELLRHKLPALRDAANRLN